MAKGKSTPPGLPEDDIHSWSNNPTPTPTQRRSARVAQMSREELVALSTTVHNKTSAHKYLLEAGFISEENEEVPYPHLSLILLQITKMVKLPTQITNAIRAVAFIIENGVTDTAANNISERIMSNLTPHFDRITEATHRIRGNDKRENEQWHLMISAIEELFKVAEKNHDTTNNSIQNIKAELGNSNNLVENMITKIAESPLLPPPPQRTSCTNAPILENMKSTIDEMKSAVEGIKEHMPPANLLLPNLARQRPATYAAAAAVTHNNLTRTQREIIARSEARDRQIAMRCKADSTKTLSEKDLTIAVNQALQPPTDTNDQPTFFCRSVRKTKGDVILIEMSSKDGAKWLRNHANRTIFTDRFNLDAQILEPVFKAKIEFVPITLDADNPHSLKNIETTSDIKEDTITKIVWMRRPTDRKPQQKVAHAFITFNSPEAANKAIRDGLVIEGKKVMAYRTYPEPMRCFRCQHLHHLINECPETEDTCGTCGEHDHRTPQCRETQANNFYCTNCRLHRHTSWDRKCPIFTQEKEKLQAQHPDRGCRFFPTNDDPSTWPDADTSIPIQTNHHNTTQEETAHRSSPPHQAHAPTNETWTTIERRQPRKNFSKPRENNKTRAPAKVRPHTIPQFNNITGTQTVLDSFLHRDTPESYLPNPSHKPSQPNTNTPPADDSPSRPIRDDLQLTRASP